MSTMIEGVSVLLKSAALFIAFYLIIALVGGGSADDLFVWLQVECLLLWLAIGIDSFRRTRR